MRLILGRGKGSIRLILRWLFGVTATSTSLLAAVLLVRAPAPVSAIWDALMLLGFIAAGALSLLPLITGRRSQRVDRSPALVVATHSLHRAFGYLLTLLVLVHGVGLLLIDPLLIEYIQPAAPGYMWAGVFCVLLCLALLWQGAYSRLKFRAYTPWRRWHAVLSVLVLASMAVHVLGSGYYVDNLAGQIVIGGCMALPTFVSLLPSLLPSWLPRWRARSARNSQAPEFAANLLWLIPLLAWLAILLLLVAVRWPMLSE